MEILEKRINDWVTEERYIRNAYRKALLAIPINPDIKFLTDERKGNPTAFIVNYKDIIEHKSNLSPYFYDFKYQARKITQILDNNELSKLDKIIHDIITKGNIRIDGYTFLFHPKVRKYLKEMYYG